MKCTKHDYEVDLTWIYTNIAENQTEPFPDYVKNIQQNIVKYLYKAGLKHDYIIKLKFPIVIYPKTDGYRYIEWLITTLCICNYREVRLRLNWHWRKWRESISFANYIEFGIKDISIEFNSIDITKNLDEIYKWLYDIRDRFGYEEKQEPQKENSDNTTVAKKENKALAEPKKTKFYTTEIEDAYIVDDSLDTPTEKTIHIPEKYHEEIFNKLKNYADNNENLKKVILGYPIQEPVCDTVR